MDHHSGWKAKNATKGVDLIGFESVEHRWLNRRTDGLFSTASTSITSKPSMRTTLCLYCGKKDAENLGKMSRRDDFQFAARLLAGAKHLESRESFYIPRGERFRKRPFNEPLRSDLE